MDGSRYATMIRGGLANAHRRRSIESYHRLDVESSYDSVDSCDDDVGGLEEDVGKSE